MTEPTWHEHTSFTDGTYQTIRERHSLTGKITLAELEQYVQDKCPEGVLNTEIAVSCHLSWQRPATTEEIDHVMELVRKKEQRHREWEGRMMRRFMHLYGDDITKWPIARDEDMTEEQKRWVETG